MDHQLNFAFLTFLKNEFIYAKQSELYWKFKAIKP